MSTTRTAVLSITERTPDIKVVRRYLPENYRAATHLRVSGAGYEMAIVITGEDVAGWTLDEYVIPRLASGGMYAKEVGRA